MKTKKLKKDKVIEIGTLLEDFNSKFDLVAEQTSQIPEIKSVLKSHSEVLDDLYQQTSQIPEIKSVLKSHSEVLDDLYQQTSQIPEIKNKVNSLVEDMEIVKTDLEFIKGSLKRKVDMDEFSALERRVISLESRLR